MPKSPTKYEATIDKLPSKSIYLNINHLEKGDYELNIINKNKIVSKTNFKKK